MRLDSGKFTDREMLLIDSFRALDSDLDINTVIKNALRLMIERLGGTAAILVLVDMRDFSLKYFAAKADDPPTILTPPLKDLKDIAVGNSTEGEQVRIDKIESGSEYQNRISEILGVRPRSVLSAPMYAGGEFLGIVQVIFNTDPGELTGLNLNLMGIVAEHTASTLRNAWILEESVRALEESRSLYDVGMALSSSLEVEELLDNILDNLKRVVEYDIGIIYLVNPGDHSISQLSSRGVPDEDKDKLQLKIGQGICGRVAETGKSIIVSDVSANTDYIPIRPEMKSEMAAPIKVNDVLIGVFNVESAEPDAYTRHHLDLMNGFASLAGVSIERARLNRERLARRRLEHELSIARRIQMTFLPPKDPVIDGVDVAGINIPSTEVGGDYYDFIPIVENQYGIAIGDVSGKGIPAALIMAAFRASLKAEIRNNFAIRAILYKVNNLLYESIERDRFVTAVYGVLDSKNGVFTFSNAGHNPPIIRRSSGDIEYLREGGVALGALPDSQYQERPISLRSGDILLFYTDGVTEVFNEEGKEYGVDRLLDALHNSCHLRAREIIDSIVRKAVDFGSSGRDKDDLTMIVIKVL